MRLIYIKDKVYIFILLLALISSGCNGYLVEKNPSEVTTDFLYSTADGLQSAVNGLYTIERAQVSENESSNFANIMGDGGTDIDFNRAAAADISRYRTDIDLTLQAPIRSWWQKWYRIIERTNSIISFGEAAALTDKEKKVILREAYTYRAYAYFWLVRKFDNIWLNIEPTTYQNIDGRTFTAAKQEDVYKQIIADLDKAIDYYATDWTVIQGRFNQGVARLLRADVAMWLKDYQTAATQSEKIITDGPFALESPDKIFLMDRKNSTKESMYVMQFDEVAAGGGPAHRLPLVFTPTYRSVPGCISVTAFGGYGWARIFPNPYLIGLYDTKNDKRFNAWWQHYYTYNDPVYDFSKLKYKMGDTLKVSQNSSLTGSNYYNNANIACKKYWDGVKLPLVTSSFNNIYILRYPLVLFTAAEAYMRLGDNTKALFYINKIRTNRLLVSPAQLLATLDENILLEEFAREMALEGHRWFMLKRLGKLVERVQLNGGIFTFRGVASPNPLYYSCRTNIQSYHVRWPIPQAERDAMGGFPQNPGYNQ
jgi:hypothetical protein